MKNINYLPILLVLVVFISSCSHKISRIGYTEKPLNQSAACVVVVQTKRAVDSKNNQKLGTVKLGDTGFSSNCDELDAIAILKKEACSIGGNFVNIIEEIRPNFGSTCYRCTADIYKIGDDYLSEKLQGVSNSDSKELIDRVDEDKKRTRRIFWTCFAIGFMIGFVAVL